MWSSGGETRYTSGSPLKLTGNAVGDEFYDFYRTPRGKVTPPAHRRRPPPCRR